MGWCSQRLILSWFPEALSTSSKMKDVISKDKLEHTNHPLVRTFYFSKYRGNLGRQISWADVEITEVRGFCKF